MPRAKMVRVAWNAPKANAMWTPNPTGENPSRAPPFLLLLDFFLPLLQASHLRTIRKLIVWQPFSTRSQITAFWRRSHGSLASRRIRQLSPVEQVAVRRNRHGASRTGANPGSCHVGKARKAVHQTRAQLVVLARVAEPAVPGNNQQNIKGTLQACWYQYGLHDTVA